ncbi:MAG: CRISPR-associated protein Csx15 [Chloroflexota bacterium]
MILVNFSHPITDEQKQQLETITGQAVDIVRSVVCQFDNALPFAEQVAAAVDEVGLSSEEWQEEAIVVNPPGYAPAATTLVAELHGRTGYFPSLMRVRPVADSNPPQFEVAEVINLHEVRERARTKR